MRLDAETHAFHRAVKHAQGRTPQRRFRLPDVAGKTHEASRLGGEKVPQGRVECRRRTSQQRWQAFLTTDGAQAAGEVDPVPGLLELVVCQPALELAFQDAAGGVGADLSEGADLEEELGAGAQRVGDFLVFAALEQGAEAALDGFHDFFVYLSGLKNLEVLADDRRIGVFWGPPELQGPSQEKCQGQQDTQSEHGKNDGKAHHGGGPSNPRWVDRKWKVAWALGVGVPALAGLLHDRRRRPAKARTPTAFHSRIWPVP